MDCALQGIDAAFLMSKCWLSLDVARAHERLTLSYLPALCLDPTLHQMQPTFTSFYVGVVPMHSRQCLLGHS